MNQISKTLAGLYFLCVKSGKSRGTPLARLSGAVVEQDKHQEIGAVAASERIRD